MTYPQVFNPATDLEKYGADPVVRYNAFSFLMDALIALNEKNRTKEFKRTLGARSYAKEYCTVRVDTGRRTGKSTYLKNRAEGKRDTILIVGNNDMASSFKGSSLNLIVASRIKHPMLSLQTTDMPYREILVDEPSFCFMRGGITIESIYEAYVSPKIEQTFIFLGE